MEKHYALCSEYVGSVFHGWQEQNNAITVQEAIRLAWLKVSGEDTHFRGSSRTDSGVSALAHVCDFTTKSPIPYERIPLILNGHLPRGLSIKGITEVSERFDARYDSVGKLYVYNIWTSPHRTALLKDFVTHCPQKVDINKMKVAGKSLEGVHDFTAFMDHGSVVRRTVRRIDRVEVTRSRPDLVSIICLGRGFLYHQVRIIAGTLWYIGQGKLGLSDMLHAMQNKDRKALGKTMPPEGLILQRVFYPEKLFDEDSEQDYEKLYLATEEELQQLCLFR